ncbi:MAG: L-fucose isomerase, partial [Christensenellaceae bacterium]|nr:L-fucose isomerase [Christensenellaceae bacterium]
MNRYQTDLPKIGIRPTVDGRRMGVREAIDDATMRKAVAAAEFLRANVKYPNGEPVEVVIADTCIGGVAEAAACQRKFEKEGVQITLTVTISWCYGTET